MIALDSIEIWPIKLDHTFVQNYVLNKLPFLSAEELTQYHRFVNEIDRYRFLATRFFLKKIISHYTQLSMTEITFVKNEFDKPYLKNATHSPLFFNLSHSKDHIVLAFYQNEIGIDLEYVDETRLTDNLAPYLVNPNDYLKNATTSALFQLWAQKEAYLKFLGTGLSFSLENVSISREQELYFANSSKGRAHLQKLSIADDFECWICTTPHTLYRIIDINNNPAVLELC